MINMQKRPEVGEIWQDVQWPTRLTITKITWEDNPPLEDKAEIVWGIDQDGKKHGDYIGKFGVFYIPAEEFDKKMEVQVKKSK